MSDWAKKIKDEARGLIAEAEQELTVLEGGDTVDLTADDEDDNPGAPATSDPETGGPETGGPETGDLGTGRESTGTGDDTTR